VAQTSRIDTIRPCTGNEFTTLHLLWPVTFSNQISTSFSIFFEPPQQLYHSNTNPDTLTRDLITMDGPDTHQIHNTKVHKHAFKDFITPDAGSVVYVTGETAALDALDFVLSRSSCIDRPVNLGNDAGTYAPLLTSINHTCELHWPELFAPVTLDELVDIQRQPWFNTLLKQYARTHQLPDHSRLTNDVYLTGDHAVVILEALAIAQRIPKMQLGVVAVCAGSFPHASYYPSVPVHSGATVWLVVVTHSDRSELYGIGSAVDQQQQYQGQEDEEEEEEEFDSGDAEEQPLNVLPSASRKTAARVVAQQIPLPAGLTAADILLYHQDRLQYVNVLKVALAFSNQKISEQCKAQAKLKQPSAVVKRINTALAWVENEFDITSDALRVAFDVERKQNGINIRGNKNAVNDDVLAANAGKINAAMAWIRSGGPRPAPAASTT